jgi:hypothetical protein
LGHRFRDLANCERLAAGKADAPNGDFSLMSRGVQKFKQADVTRAAKGVTKAGLSVQRVVIEEDGKIIVFTAKPGKDAVENPWDDVS